MRIVLIACLAAALVAACGKKEETATLDPVEAARKAVEDASKMPDVSVDVATMSGPELAQHFVDQWGVYGKTPDNYAMAESMVMIDDLPPEAKSVGVRGTAGFHFQGAAPYFQDVLVAYAMFDRPSNAEEFIDNLSDSNAAEDGGILEQSYPLGREGEPQLDFRCSIVPDTGNSVSCYYQDFSGQIVTTILFSGGPETDPNASQYDNEQMDALDTVFKNEDASARIFGFADASSSYLATVTKQRPRQ